MRTAGSASMELRSTRARPSISIRFIALGLFFAFSVFACLTVEDDLPGVLGVVAGVTGVFITGQAMRPSGRPFPFGRNGCSTAPTDSEEGSLPRIEGEG